MAVGTATAAAIAGGGALLGGIAGSQGKKATSTSRSRLRAAGESEVLGGQVARQQLRDLRALTALGPGARDVTGGLQAQRQFASDIAALRERGGLPTEEQFEQAGAFVETQRVALEQRLEDERRRVARLAGRLGRSQDDPVLQAKLAQTAARGQERLSAQQAQVAQQLPFQQLQLSQQLARVRQGLASQALANRQNLFNIGAQLQSQGQSFRAGTATRTTTQRSGGGLAGALTGIVGGAGASLNIASGLGGLIGDGGGGGGTVFAGGSPGPSRISEGGF